MRQLYQIIAPFLLAVGGWSISKVAAESIELVHVPISDAQTGGPSHDFRIGKYEVSNAEFAEFLNDALEQLDRPEGAYLFHDLTGGSVYLHPSEAGEAGLEPPSDPAATPVYSSPAGRITYDSTDRRYEVALGYTDHPVTGVSWYGAAKFCNWLTLKRAMPLSARAYNEGPDLADWQAVIEDPESQITLPGFRLPMDGGGEGVHPYNEWFKAATRRSTTSGEPPAFGAVYGFGRDVLANNDANFVANGDAIVTGTTRRGFFNGVNAMASGGLTHDTANGYRLYDFCGNVAEWAHERSLVDGVMTGATRGGHFNLDRALPQLRNDSRVPLPADSAFSFVGFRVAQSLEPVAPLYSVDDATLNAEGPFGGFFDRESFEFVVTNPAPYSLDDLSIRSDTAWLKPGSTEKPLVPPGATESFHLVLHNAESLSVGLHEAEVELVDGVTGAALERVITLKVTEPFHVEGPEEIEWNTPFCVSPTAPSATFRVVNHSVAPMTWQVGSDQTWLTARGPGGAASGVIPGRNDPLLFHVDVEVALNHLVSGLTPGEHLAKVTLRNANSGAAFVREIRLTVGAAVDVVATDPAPSFTGLWQGPFAGPASVDVTVSRCGTCGPDCDLTLAVEADVPWLRIEPEDDLEAPIPPGESMVFQIALDQAAASLLVPGVHEGVVRFVTVPDGRAPLPNPPVLRFRLTIGEPIEAQLPAEPWRIGCEPQPGDPPTYPVTLRNRHGGAELSARITTGAPYVAVEPEVVALLPGASTVVNLVLVDQSLPLLDPVEFPLFVNSLSTGVTLDQDITLRRADGLCVQPLTDFETTGRAGGRLQPGYFVLRLANVSDKVIPWSLTTDAPWLVVDEDHAASGAMSPGQRGHTVLVIDESLLPPTVGGSLTAVAEARVVADEEPMTRRVTVSMAEPVSDPRLAIVPATAAQPGGPTYSFEMGVFPVTNGEFAAFLNDAMAHPGDARGAFLHVDSLNGDVYLNDSSTGSMGEGSAGRTVKLFSPAAGGRIDWADGRYEVRAEPHDFADHPVVGVSWYGAVKYGNWLTIDQGYGVASRCYGEGADDELSRWRPVTIAPATWSARDLNDTERGELVNGCRGFRLPMDDGYANADPTRDAADAFNEYFKAAAWNAALSRNAAFGFGRDILTTSDANFRCSGDPFEAPSNCLQGGTTPVGFYDGSLRDVNGVAFATATNANSFGLFDLTGNVNLWMQDRYAPSTTLDRRSIRGGSWDDAATSDALKLNRRVYWATPGTVSNKIGFRVVRAAARARGDADGDGAITAFDVTHATVCHSGPGSPFLGGCESLDFDGDGDVDLYDWIEFVGAMDANGN